MMFGWKPKLAPVAGAPIPLYYDYEEFDEPINKMTGELLPILYYGYRPKDSLVMHKEFVGSRLNSYEFKFPTGNFEAVPVRKKRHPEEQRPFTGTNP